MTAGWVEHFTVPDGDDGKWRCRCGRVFTGDLPACPDDPQRAAKERALRIVEADRQERC